METGTLCDPRADRCSSEQLCWLEVRLQAAVMNPKLLNVREKSFSGWGVCEDMDGTDNGFSVKPLLAAHRHVGFHDIKTCSCTIIHLYLTEYTPHIHPTNTAVQALAPPTTADIRAISGSPVQVNPTA